MFEEYATASGPSSIVGLDLHTVWHVRADRGYDIRIDRSIKTSRQIHRHGGTGLIALRSLAGLGRITLQGSPEIELQAGQLVVLDWERLLRYRCMGESWHFWWFEFNCFGAAHLTMYQPVATVDSQNEAASIGRICSLLRRFNESYRRLASAQFGYLLYQWLAGETVDQPVTNSQSAMERIIDLMHSRFYPPLTVAEMARSAGLSERHFRTRFKQVTQVTPKKYYNQIRLTLARRLLAQKRMTLTEIADRLGFSSPFHFSYEFKRFFGYSPSKCGSRMD